VGAGKQDTRALKHNLPQLIFAMIADGFAVLHKQSNLVCSASLTFTTASPVKGRWGGTCEATSSLCTSTHPDAESLALQALR
jgi:hypothetical protein